MGSRFEVPVGGLGRGVVAQRAAAGGEHNFAETCRYYVTLRSDSADGSHRHSLAGPPSPGGPEPPVDGLVTPSAMLRVRRVARRVRASVFGVQTPGTRIEVSREHPPKMPVGEGPSGASFQAQRHSPP